MSRERLVEEIEELHIEDAKIKFGINTVGDVGNIAIGKVGVGVIMKSP